MGIIRKDYILERYVFYATARGSRPVEFKKIIRQQPAGVCYFCPGSEALTPKEIGRKGSEIQWSVRWFQNKFPAAEKRGSPKLSGTPFLKESSNYGVHEVIVETPQHHQQLADFPVERIAELLKVYHERIAALSRDKGCAYVSVFKNHGRDAGTSLLHEHSQLISVPQLPSTIREKCDAIRDSRSCPYCAIIRKEAKTERNAGENDAFIAIAPFASRFNYEAWIFPKRHLRIFDDFRESDFLHCAALLKKILMKLQHMDASYNYYVHYSPKKEGLHFHIEVTPRIATYGGFELGTGFVINSVMPEDAAAYYRG